MNSEMYKSPEAVKIMKGMPGTYTDIDNVSAKLSASIQAFCEDAQISLINRHQPNMNPVERRRAELVKSGQYHGQAIK